MPEVLTRPPESKQDVETKRPKRTLRPSSFKYYIHDSVKNFRLQLIGDLTASDVTELDGTWETAKCTLGNRTLVLDLHQLESADQEGRLWIEKMKTFSGASDPGKNGNHASAAKLNLTARIKGLFRP